MSWAGGLAGGALGFMMFPGASIIGAALGAGLGGMAGNAISDNKYRIGSLPSRLLNGGMSRLGGGFMGPTGVLLEDPFNALTIVIFSDRYGSNARMVWTRFNVSSWS